jgi:hypothetical protein
MNAIQYKTKTGTVQYKPEVSSEELHDGTMGFCLACGTEVYGIEPDARRDTCESCDAPKVYGLEELALMGLLVLSEDE